MDSLETYLLRIISSSFGALFLLPAMMNVEFALGVVSVFEVV